MNNKTLSWVIIIVRQLSVWVMYSWFCFSYPEFTFGKSPTLLGTLPVFVLNNFRTATQASGLFNYLWNNGNPFEFAVILLSFICVAIKLPTGKLEQFQKGRMLIWNSCLLSRAFTPWNGPILYYKQSLSIQKQA